MQLKIYLGRNDFTHPILNSCLHRKPKLELFLKLQVYLRFQRTSGWSVLAF